MVNENKHRPKKTMWQILKEVGSSTKCKTKESSKSLDIGKELFVDNVKVATNFKDFSCLMLPHLLTICQSILVNLVKATLWNFTIIYLSQKICLV